MFAKSGLIVTVFGLILVFHITGVVDGCGVRLGKGVLMCHIGERIHQYFDLSLCTHFTVPASLNCQEGLCSPYITTEIESVLEWLQPKIPTGVYIPFELSHEEFLGDRERRVETAKSIVTFMGANNFSYVQFFEYSWDRNFKNSFQRNFFSFLKALSGPVHLSGWHIGVTIEFGIKGLLANYDLADMARYLDWFNFPPHRFERREGPYFYLGSYTPLTSSTNQTGTFKYWIEYVLQWLKPECVIIEISARGKKYTAKDTMVEPGPGSLAVPQFSHVGYKEICTRIIDDRCPVYWSEEDSTPWAICGPEFYAFDNPRSAKLKADLVQKFNVAGANFFNLSFDDDDSTCGNGTFPMLRAMQGIRT